VDAAVSHPVELASLGLATGDDQVETPWPRFAAILWRAGLTGQPNEQGIETMKLTTMTQVTVDGAHTTDSEEAGR
jgi:hypothetical protein